MEPTRLSNQPGNEIAGTLSHYYIVLWRRIHLHLLLAPILLVCLFLCDKGVRRLPVTILILIVVVAAAFAWKKTKPHD
jgi:hypothetical protein